MHATKVWFGNRQWPSGASPGAFARDVFRIEACTTDKQRALVFYKWLQRCLCAGPMPKIPGLGGLLETANPVTTFAWGFHSCTGFGWVAVEALQSAGLKARRVVHHSSSHTIYEVWYRGDNGKEGWHAFDAEFGWYFFNDEGEVASCAELAANPDFIIHPRGGSPRYGNYPNRTLRNYPFRTADSLEIVQPVLNEELSFDMQLGQSFETLWRPEVPRLCWGTPDFPRGPHCDISLLDETGRLRFPEHAPYWQNYLWPNSRNASPAGDQPVRWHGCGALRWQPLLYGEKVTWRADNAIFENGTLRPAGVHKHCEVWWHFKLPYLATYLQITPVVENAGAATIGIAVSADAGKSMHTIHWKQGEPPKFILHGPGEMVVGDAAQKEPAAGPSIRGLREFWLRLDVSSKATPMPRVLSLDFSVGYQLNMQTLPRLLAGDNTLYLQSGALDGARLEAEWVFTGRKGQQIECLQLQQAGETHRVVNPGVEAHEDLIMRGVSLRCLPV